ncbi:C-type lectin domain-containing protein [Chryseobacterium taeanense]|uniref:C-type lectin domain-containing protein n=1 Tax=Chryseobacterium taeanense TaxID=311334 RepID=UPI0035B42C0E
MKHLFTTAAVLFSMTAFAQVGINTKTPYATLDIKAKSPGTNPEGLLIPKLSGTDIQNGPYGSNQTGTLVYATAVPSAPNTVTAEITEPGFYYFNGTKWKKINSSGSTISYTTIADPNILGYVPSTTATASVDAPATLTVGSATATRQGTGSFGGHTYASYSTNATVTWYQAYNAAKNMGGYLAVFTSDAEWQYVETNLLTPFTIFNTNGGHIGMARFSWGAGPGLVPDPEMKWISGEQPYHDYSAGGTSAVRKANWFYSGQPGGATEGFVAFVRKGVGNTMTYNGYTSTHPWHDIVANNTEIGLTGGFIVEFQQ